MKIKENRILTFKHKLNLPFSSWSLLLLLAAVVAFFISLSISYTSSFHSFAVWNRYPFSLLVKYELWNLFIFMICIVFQRLSHNLPMFVFVFVKKLTRISLAIMLVPGFVGEYETCLLDSSANMANTWGELYNDHSI